MAEGRPVSQAELETHFAEQVRFLKASAAAFDGGFEGEAKRLAVGLRILLHDKKNSKSLLGLLERKTQPFWDLTFPPTPGSLIPHASLVVMTIGGTNAPRYFAPLDETPVRRQIPFDDWWRADVFAEPQAHALSRRTLVLSAADQDGGAHVDPTLNESYARFSRDNALGWQYPTSAGDTPLVGATQAAIRQIAHEVLKTLEPGYSKMPDYGDAAVIAGAPSFVKVEQQPVVRGARIGRNEPCPCGSGRKFKRCHGQ